MKLPEVSNDWKLWQLDGFFVAYRKWIGGLIPDLHHKTITANVDWYLWLQPWLRGQDWMSLENKLPFNPEKSILWARSEAHTRLRKNIPVFAHSTDRNFASTTNCQCLLLRMEQKMEVLWEGLGRLITYNSLWISLKHTRLQLVWCCGTKCCAGAVQVLNSPLSTWPAIETNGTGVGTKMHHYQSLTDSAWGAVRQGNKSQVNPNKGNKSQDNPNVWQKKGSKQRIGSWL